MSDLRVLLVDDHEVVRAGLRALIDAQEDMAVVGEAGTAEAGIRHVGFDSPDVVMLDVRLPDRERSGGVPRDSLPGSRRSRC